MKNWPQRRSNLQCLFWGDARAGIAYAVAVAIALGLVMHLYPLAFLAGRGGFFEGGDAATNVAGWLFFSQDDWHFPVLKTQWLSYPEGTSIAFTDSIPLLALPLKLLSRLLPPGFHYFGLWHALCYVLQAIGAVFLIRSLGVRHLPGAVMASAFALCWPALTFRFGHAALMTQGLLLIALGVYLRGCNRDQPAAGDYLKPVALSVIALLVHPYLLAMIYPLFLVYLAKQWRTQAIKTTHVFGWVLGSLALLAVIMVIGGYFIGKGTAADGYGVFSLNLLAPFCGGSLCAFVDGTGGQGEGFNYFGAGLLFLLPTALIVEPKALPAAIAKHRYLFILLLMLTLYALSSHIYLGKWALISIDLPRWLQSAFGVFRVSGRFFWLVGYCVLFFVLALLLRKKSPLILGLIGIAFIGQWFDTQGLRNHVLLQSNLASTINIAAWRAALNGTEQLDIYPPYGCSTRPTDEYAYYQYIAARAGLRINTGYTARQTVNCEEKSAFASLAPLAGHVYVHLGFATNQLALPPLYSAARRTENCAMTSSHLLCRSGLDQVRWEGLAVPLTSTQNALRQHWNADQLPSIVGRLQDGRLVPRHSGITGYLSYGPYISLPAGLYQYRIDYLSDAEMDIGVGEWDVVGESTGKIRTLARGILQGSNGQAKQIQGLFALDHALEKVEIRLLSNGRDVQLSSITIVAGQDSIEHIVP